MAAAALPLTGGCGCAAVRFGLVAAPVSASHCHCPRCRRRTGTAASAQGRVGPGRPPGGGEIVSVRLGAFDGDPGVRPSWRAFVNYAAPWEPIPDDGLERFAEAKPQF